MARVREQEQRDQQSAGPSTVTAGLLGAFFLGLFIGIGATVLATLADGGPVLVESRRTLVREASVKTQAADWNLAPPGGKEITAQVVRVVDGDTIQVLFEGTRWKIRYLGIDTPESHASSKRSVERYGKEASLRNAELVRDKTVRLVFDGRRKDRFGRLLCYVWVGEQLINRTLLAEGWARVYRKAPKIRYYQEFCDLERTARRRRVGLWR